MLSIIILFLIFLGCLIGIKISKKTYIRYLALGSFLFLVIEGLTYAYFLFAIYKGTCFFLMNNQKVLDGLIKTRLIYSTYYAQGKKNFMNRLDEDLGYSLGKNKNNGTYQTNAQGFRASREYSLIPKDDVLRLAAFGDSFVFCDGEKNEDTWAHQLEEMVDNLEVLNFGVPGYGLGQSYLRYLRDGIKFKPDIVFFNYVKTGPRDRIIPSEIVGRSNLRMAHFYRVRFWLEGDILRSKSMTPFDLFDVTFKDNYIFKPLGVDMQTGLGSNKIFSNINAGLLLKSSFYQKQTTGFPVNTEYSLEDEKINVAILSRLLKIAKEQGSMVLFFFEGSFSEFPLSVRDTIKQYQKHVVYVNAMTAQHSPYTLDKEEQKKILNRSSHFTAEGNALYAQAILEILKSHRWGRGGKRQFTYEARTNSFRKK